MNHRSDQLLGVIGAVRKRRNLLIVLRGGDHGRRDCGDARHHGSGRVPLPLSAAALVSLRVCGLERDRRRLLRPVRPLRRRASDAQLAACLEENIQALKTASSARSSFQAKRCARPSRPR